jgi:plastocyanin
MKGIIAVSMLLFGVLVLSGCGSNGASSTSVPAVAPAQRTTVSSNNINIQNFAFSPETLTVTKGTTVTWINNDSAPHQIKSATFNSGQLGKGQSFSFTFNDVGAFDYSCAIHPSMLGKIIVE